MMQSEFSSACYLAPAIGCLAGFAVGLTTETIFGNVPDKGIGATIQLIQTLAFSALGVAFGSGVNLVVDTLLSHSYLNTILSVAKLGFIGACVFYPSQFLFEKICKSERYAAIGAVAMAAVCCYNVI